MDKTRILAVIPARGGSKRIPKKNIIDFMGLPMIAWTIKAGLDSKLIDDVFVSTDDNEIREISKEYGAIIPFLREKHTDDYAPSSLISIDSLDRFRSELGKEYDIVVQLLPSCPNRTAEEIDTSLEYFIDYNIEFQISCFAYGWMNPWWAHKLNSDNQAEPIFPPEVWLQRSQDQPTVYCPTGAIWIAKVQSLLREQTFYGRNYTFKPISWMSAVDIDTYEDIYMAQLARNLRDLK